MLINHAVKRFADRGTGLEQREGAGRIGDIDRPPAILRKSTTEHISRSNIDQSSPKLSSLRSNRWTPRPGSPPDTHETTSRTVVDVA